jgi:hypothetical protein
MGDYIFNVSVPDSAFMRNSVFLSSWFLLTESYSMK